MFCCLLNVAALRLPSLCLRGVEGRKGVVGECVEKMSPFICDSGFVAKLAALIIVLRTGLRPVLHARSLVSGLPRQAQIDHVVTNVLGSSSSFAGGTKRNFNNSSATDISLLTDLTACTTCLSFL